MMKETRKGFTITELMLAMAFLGTMLVGIAALVMRVTNIYQKGLSLRDVNSTGRELISDLTRSINSSPTDFDINPEVTGGTGSNGVVTSDSVVKAHAQYFLSVDYSGKQIGGVFCTGSYSYVWNTAENLKSGANSARVFKITAKDGTMTPRFARFVDRQRNACASDVSANGKKYTPAASGVIKKGVYKFDVSETATLNDVVELIAKDESNLAVYDFRILPATQNNTTKQIFFSGSFILATLRGGVNIQSNGDFCRGDEADLGDSDFTLADFDYCAVNKFNFAARATGEASIKQYGDD